MNSVFEVCRRIGKVEFPIGFCEGWAAVEEFLALRRPFTQAQWQSPFGLIEFRGGWKNPLLLPAASFSISSHRFQPWMLIGSDELCAAMRICAECSTELSNRGFNRLRGCL